MGVFRAKYIGDTLFPQRSPNNIWWALYGRLQFTYERRRLCFCVRFRKYARGWFFSFPVSRNLERR